MGTCEMLSLTHELITGLDLLEGRIRQTFKQAHLMKQPSFLKARFV